MKTPDVSNNQPERVQQVKHVKLGDNIFAVDDILRVARVEMECNPEAHHCHVYLRSAPFAHIPVNVKACAHEFKIMIEVLCGETKQ